MIWSLGKFFIAQSDNDGFQILIIILDIVDLLSGKQTDLLALMYMAPRYSKIITFCIPWRFYKHIYYNCAIKQDSSKHFCRWYLIYPVDN